MELRWSASRSRAVKALCEHDAKTSYTHARAGSRSAVDKLAIVAEPYLAIALAPDAKLQHLRAVEQCASRRRVTRSVDVARSSDLDAVAKLPILAHCTNQMRMLVAILTH